MILHALVPAGFSTRSSGGNIYDRHVLSGLVARGWRVEVHEVDSGAQAGRVLAGLPARSLVLADSLVVSYAASALLDSGATVVPLVHMLFGARLEHELLSQAPAVITTSNWTRNVLVTDAGLDPRRVHVATPGVDVATRSPGTSTGVELFCLATVTPHKGHDVLLEALATLTDLPWHCTLVGSLDSDPVWVDTVRKQAADSGLGDRVHFAGEMTGPRLEEAWSRADLLVVPSPAETFGMVVTEALARSVPVVASAAGGLPEAVGELEDGTLPGMLVRPGDPPVLARALRRWLEDEPLRIWLRRRALARSPHLPRWPQTAAVVSWVLEELR